jgi:integrase
MKLTDALVRKLSLTSDMPDGKVFFDEELPRFGVRVYRSGRKLWFCQYRFGGNTRRHIIGLTTEKTADQARDRAKDIFAHVRLGTDPEAERQQAHEKAKDLFEVRAEEYLDEKLHPIKAGKKPMRPRSYEEIERHLKMHCAPFSTKPIGSITQADVADLYKKIAKRNGPGAAARTWSTLRAFLHWAMRKGLVEKNAAALYDGGGTSDPRERTLTDAEIAIVWKACNADQFGDIVKLLILTGARRDEVGHMHMDELDLDNKKWLLPEERSKNRREHLFTLSDTAVDILTNTVETRETHVFGYGTERGFSGWSKAKKALDKRIADAGHKLDHWQLHDLRRSFASGLQRLKIEPHVIEECLNHTPPKLQRTYQTHDFEPEKRAALARWAAHVDAIVTGKTIDNVVSIREAAI